MNMPVNGNPVFPAIGREHFRSIVPHPAVAVLRAPGSESGYLSVYRNDRGTRWFAKIRVNGQLMRLRGSAAALPHQAALHVVRWYADRYGPQWPQFVNRRLRIAHTHAWEVRQSPRYGGWVACVWEWGQRTEVTGRRKRRHAGDRYDTPRNCRPDRGRALGRMLVFRTRAEAEGAVLWWVCERWGLFVESVVWRCDLPQAKQFPALAA